MLRQAQHERLPHASTAVFRVMAKLLWCSVDLDAGSIRIYRNKVDSADTFYMTGRLKEVIQHRLSKHQKSHRPFWSE
ncbi:MAG TPA: hypothetical protein VIJ25_00260 [Methylococcales bacterium]